MDNLNSNDFELDLEGNFEGNDGDTASPYSINTSVLCSLLTNITEGLDCATAGITATY